MVSTSNDGIMTEYLVKYLSLMASQSSRPQDMLETLYVTERYRAGDDLKTARARYDQSVWNAVPIAEIGRRLAELDTFMRDLAKERAAMWGLRH
ncbi:hypothetical protein [Sphingomonas sp.]|uniref:hypothetical protein n=1 Tax=Sphingomonas sp. TaxID=28214 RepID=UPI003B3B17AA